MAIFNSLGSNYDFRFALKALRTKNKGGYRNKLQKLLEERYKGKAILTYKGRDAIRLALSIIDLPKKYAVGICGYTCYAVYEAIVKEGYKVHYLDIDPDNINFSYVTLKKNLQEFPSIKVLIVQNTLGYPCDIEQIALLCQDLKIMLIEDLAHSIGTRYASGFEAGTVGDFTALSFSQDKMVDGISGGALIVRNSNFQFPISNFQLKEINKNEQVRDRFYPSLTYIIRYTYGWGLGKVLHAVLRGLKLLSQPMSHLNTEKIYTLADWYCVLIYLQFKNLENDLEHRKKIASVYAKNLPNSVLSGFLCDQSKNSANLRFPIFVKQREDLIKFLKKKSVFLSDIWYESPVAPKKYLRSTDYEHQCPNSEKVSDLMVNLPTHRNVSKRDAEFIAEKIKEWINRRHES